jgi:CrcB protein
LEVLRKDGATTMVWLSVAVGGALGSVARHAVNHVIHQRWLVARFPLGTLVVNVAGCFVIGVLAGAVASERLALRFWWREFVFVGLLGGFTTFSTFGLDTFLLARSDGTGAAALNVAAQVVGGLIAL